MPVAPAFNPTTGASGGAPPAASASLANLPLTVVDLTDGSWTLEDPDNLVASVTHAGGDNIVTWNALAAGSADYNWSGGTNHRAPRWYKLLDIDGTQVVSTDHLAFTSRLQNNPSVNDFDQQVVIGAAFDPTSTVASTIDGTGGMFAKTASGNPAYGTWQVNSSTSGTNANNLYGVATVLRGHNALGSGVYLNSDSSSVVRGAGSRNSNQLAATTGSQNVYVMVGVGPRANTNTISANDQQRFKASFVAVTMVVS